MNIHVVMPFSRIHNYNILHDILEPENVIWDLILSSYHGMGKEESWVRKHCVYDIPSNWDIAYYKLNWFIKNIPIEDNDLYFMFMCDDDSIPKGFFNHIRNIPIPKHGFVIGADRGYRTPKDAIRKHPPGKVRAFRENVGKRGFGVCRLMVRGSFLKQITYNNSTGGDGELLIELNNKYTKDEFVYLNNVYYLFNYFEPGRWEK